MGYDIKRKVGLRARELRDMRGLSQEAFANDIGMARTYYAEIEGGKRNVSIVNLERIAHGLGIGLGEFFSAPEFDRGAYADTGAETSAESPGMQTESVSYRHVAL